MSTPLSRYRTKYRLAAAQPIFQRFLWKEYRMLRGFWLAVGGLAVIAQAVVPHLKFDARVATDQVFAIAWGAAALYAVGAAITLFSAEREEQTRDFLMLLPGRWLPICLAKVLFAVVSAVALALVLSLAGVLVTEGTLPTPAARHEILAVAGVAIVEAIAWGLLFSLWMKQPLLAAVVSIAAASLGAQAAVAATSRASQAFTTTAFGEAVPTRLLVCCGVFMIDVWLASRWFTLVDGSRHSFLRRRQAKLRDAAGTSATDLVRVGVRAERPRRRRILARLLWQTWRESWPTILLAVPIALLMMAAIFATFWLSGTPAIALFLCPLLLPALFGALVFRADQRRGHRQFLVAHAGRPRYVWLARQILWLTSLVLLAGALQLAAMGLVGGALHESSQQKLRYQDLAFDYYPSVGSIHPQLQLAISALLNLSSTGWCAVLAAYGLGQLGSMLLSREVLAGFLAIGLGAAVAGWAMVVGAWQLNPGWFVLPIGAVALAATWLRAPDWMVARNRCRSWLAPLLVIVVPLVVVFATLPQVRLDQVAFVPSPQLHKFLVLQKWYSESLRNAESSPVAARETTVAFAPSLQHYKFLQKSLHESLRDYESTLVAARETTTAYERLHATLVPWEAATKDVQVDGTRPEDLESLDHESAYGEMEGEYGGEYGGEDDGHYGGELRPSKQQQMLDRFYTRFLTAQRHALAEANQEAINQLEALSQHRQAIAPLHADRSVFTPWHINNELVDLLLADASRLMAQSQLEKALGRYLSAARMPDVQTTAHTYSYDWHLLSYGLRSAILVWAQHSDQTSQSIKAAIGQLQTVFDGYPSPREEVLANYRLVRDVVLGKELPTFLKHENPRLVEYLPHLQNRLPWEHERGLRALDLLTTQNLNYVDAIQHDVEGGDVWKWAGRQKRVTLQELLATSVATGIDLDESTRLAPLYEGRWDDCLRMLRLTKQCQTSYLVSQELSVHGDLSYFLVEWIRSRIAQQGLLTQLALLAYRLDHESYPETLDELTPDYIAWQPRDPYSRQPFVYFPKGLERPLLQSYNSGKLTPGTPVFWSVGVSQCVLKQQRVNQYGEGSYGYGDTGNETEGESDTFVELMYVLEPTWSYRDGWYSANSVFPLPVD